MIALDLARAKHRIFVDQLHLLASGFDTQFMTPSTVADETQCALGRWLLESAAQYQKFANFELVIAAHRQFHGAASRYLTSAQTASASEVEAKIELDAASIKVLDAIDRLQSAFDEFETSARKSSVATGYVALPSSWHADLVLGHQTIDDHHQALVRVMDRLACYPAQHLNEEEVVNGLSELLSLFDMHFAVEEALMRSLMMPENEVIEHHNQNSAILESLADMLILAMTDRRKTINDIIDKLRNMVVLHIREDDMWLHTYLPTLQRKQ